MSSDSSAAWKARHRRWLHFVVAIIHAVESGKAIPLGPTIPALKAAEGSAARGARLKVIVCSPHPDDEALIGALPLRLQQECGSRVTNVAITLGSALDQRARRRRELKASCAVLGFNLVVANAPHGFDDIVLETRTKRPKEWAKKVRALSLILEHVNPDVVFAPHVEDVNVTHVATHHLVVDATADFLKRTQRGPLAFIETEFWHEHSCPNLMVGISPADEAILLMAAAEHGVEVRRNPYHLRHPARMIDNVRRGAEIVLEAGGPAPDVPLAEIYRLVFVSGQGMMAPRPGGRLIRPEDRIEWKSLVEHFRPVKPQAQR